MEQNKELIILIAEDDDGHAELIKEGLEEVGLLNKQFRFANGKEAWDFLLDNKHDKTKSFLLLLDINMPVLDGVGLLKLIKQDEMLKETQVIMLTTTDDPIEVEECYRLGCNFYITKPIDFQQFAETLARLGFFIKIIKI